MPDSGKALRDACVIGWPVAHSRSPLIHNYWLHQYHIAAEYRCEAVRPGDFASFVSGLAERRYAGANVTLPHKEAALELSLPDDRAIAVGAANTIWCDGKLLRSTNTDVEGFTGNLDHAAPGWDRWTHNAVVLGSGGSARAVVHGLIERGFTHICLVNRTLERAEALRDRFGSRIFPVRWSALPHVLTTTGLLVNTTSLGMTGQPPLPIDLSPLPDDSIVADIVYSPLETPLLAAAKQRGFRTADGLGMLLCQAVRGFALWFGIRPEVTAELRALVEADLVTASPTATR